MTVVRILLSFTQSYTFAYVEAVAELAIAAVLGGGGGGLGRADSGIHFDEESAPLNVFATFSRCEST